MNSYLTYQNDLIKPTWAPSPDVFGPVWTFLYVLIAISFITVFVMAWKKKIPFMAALPFLLNIIFNLIYTPIQFGLKNNILASIDILLILATLIWAMTSIYKHKKWITYIQIPYVLWVSFATVLQVAITYLNL